jgi:hypothetical protein
MNRIFREENSRIKKRHTTGQYKSVCGIVLYLTN